MIRIDSYEAPRELTPWIHRSFIVIYLLLVIRALVAVYEGPIDFSRMPQNSLAVLLIKRAAGIAYQPFSHVLTWFPHYGNADLYSAIFWALLMYGLIHYAMVMNVSIGERSMADRILKMCKAMFFLMGTLMLLLIVLRMGVMLYQDVTFGRLTLIQAPAQTK